MASDDILDRIAQDARRLRVARNLPEGKLSWDWIQRVQQDFEELLHAQGLSVQQVSRKLGKGFSPSTLSQFRSMESGDEYIGDIDRIVRGINQFIETYVRSQQVQRPRDWIDTAVAKRMMSVIRNSVELTSIGIIYSDAGRGKTMTLQAASQTFPGSILLRIGRRSRTCPGLARTLARTLRMKSNRTTGDLEEALIDQLTGSGRLILIDEAHQLDFAALELLRDLHDECALPIVFAGTIDINKKLTDSDVFYGQFNRRVAARYDVTENQRDGGGSTKPLHSVDEIRRMFQGEQVRLTDDGATTLMHMANLLGMGGLGLCNQVMLMAQRVAEDGIVDSKTILKVVKQMHGVEHYKHRVERAIENSDVKAA